MDKRVSKILVACLLCTVVVAILFIVALRFSHTSCELIIIEPAKLRNQSMSNWPKNRPLRSLDNSTLLKISAHLEYNLNQESQKVANEKSEKLPAASGLALLNNQHGNVSINPTSQSHQSQVHLQVQNKATIGGGSSHPMPSMPQHGFNSSQIQNSSVASIHSTAADGAIIKEKKYLPLEAKSLDMQRLSGDKFKYTVGFNCMTLVLMFRRNEQRVYVEEMNVELKVDGKKKVKCQIELNNKQNLGIQLVDGLGHYYCEREMRLDCYQYNKRQANQPKLLVGQLVINAIEYETGNNTSPISHLGHEFLAARRDCLGDI